MCPSAPIDLALRSKPYYEVIGGMAKSDKEHAKVLGQFYTHDVIASAMAREAVDAVKRNARLCAVRTCTVGDPFCGDGRLVTAFLSEVSHEPWSKDFLFLAVLWDVSQEAVEAAKRNVEECAASFGLNVRVEAEQTDSFVVYKQRKQSFDICLTNPPWGLLKPQKSVCGHCSAEELELYRSALLSYAAYLDEEFPHAVPSGKYAGWGTNLGRCGWAVALSLIAEDGICGIVSPSSLFTDMVSAGFREWVFRHFRFSSVSYFPAGLRLFSGADISSLYALVCRGETGTISLKRYVTHAEAQTFEFGPEIWPLIQQSGYVLPLEQTPETLELMHGFDSFPTMADFCSARGLKFVRELDETRVQEKLTTAGKIRFAKGYMVGRFRFDAEELYLDEARAAVPQSVLNPKLVWRDVSRNSQKRRMQATLLPENHIVGNSLGALISERHDDALLSCLLAFFNSWVFEFLVRPQLSTNHVSAGTLKRVRIPDFCVSERMVWCVGEQLRGAEHQAELDVLVALQYGLSWERYLVILHHLQVEDDEIARLCKAWQNLGGENTARIPNHTAAKLSDLDMLVVRSVPPGGNWKNIPESIPSKRLEQIRESFKAGKGSRSTYYGRLRPEMPSYTVNTYFNRPGNGCHIHYEQDRTLSQREAARLQTFPDSFVFKGAQGAVNKQIGNAVPALLAYQIAKALPFKGQFIDLFCGAGGLALGFIWAGWTPVISNDIDKSAILTHEANIKSPAVCGDINAPDVRERIVAHAEEARRQHPELPLFVLGGPPCQGFSTANTRRGEHDERNWLFKAYSSVLAAIKPEGFIFENVLGITNLNGGRFFGMIREELGSLVESLKVNRVNAAEFAIPQRRERVIIIGGAAEVVDAFSLTPVTEVVREEASFRFLPRVIGVQDALSDLPAISHAQDGSGLDYRTGPQNPFQAWMRGQISAEEYLRNL